MDGAQKPTLTELEQCKAIIAQQSATIELLKEQIEKGKVFDNNYINTEEAAILLCVTPRTIRKYNYEGKITGRKRKKESRLIFPLKEVMQYRKENFKHWASFE
ncbi:helix-turn-helix domain-containing protein [Aureispira anguillae]|uniref:Helix-turn-helix domain-containing protein n=1 Tax=Aureispira anguillae TaxID=2864201 RepID=A0A915YFQ8_9BACT|nr:helix-turn-helix domain-containing protein [Aureispira anguillae]BDS12317.1 helix-turn-helix domain-containing protein [Aureispira anguillae]